MSLIAQGAGAAAGGILGGIAGSQDDVQKTRQWIEMADDSQLSRDVGQGSKSLWAMLQELTGKGPGEGAVGGAREANDYLGTLLMNYANSGGMPDSDMVRNANSFAGQIFAPRREEMNQFFEDEDTRIGRLAAQLGRPVNDPILQAKLAGEKSRRLSSMGAEQGAFAANYANQLSQNRVTYAGQRSNLFNELASQAFRNRAALLELGNSITGSERNWQLNRSTRMGEATDVGGLKGGIEGFMAGAGMGASAASKFGVSPSFQQSGGMGSVTDLSGSMGAPYGSGIPMGT